MIDQVAYINIGKLRLTLPEKMRGLAFVCWKWDKVNKYLSTFCVHTVGRQKEIILSGLEIQIKRLMDNGQEFSPCEQKERVMPCNTVVEKLPRFGHGVDVWEERRNGK